jgi:hypothetical protein
MACILFAASTVSAGPAAVAGELSVTVTLPLAAVSCVLVAVTVTVAGAGYGVSYRPDELIDPALRPVHDVQVTDHVTVVLKLPVPCTFAVNCCCVPIVAVLGVTVIDVIGEAVFTVTEALPDAEV